MSTSHVRKLTVTDSDGDDVQFIRDPADDAAGFAVVVNMHDYRVNLTWEDMRELRLWLRAIDLESNASPTVAQGDPWATPEGGVDPA